MTDGPVPMLSVVVPAKDEAAAIRSVLDGIRAALARLPCPSEIVLVDDGSTDDTAAIAASVPGVEVISNPVNLGYGHSLLRGIEVARGELIAIIDADGTYPSDALVDLHGQIGRGADHAIGSRTGPHFAWALSMRHVYRALCGYVVGQRVPDANSGLRIFHRRLVEGLRTDLCLGFSFTTSLTLASIMSGYVVTFTPIPYNGRVGRSHVRMRDVLRTMQYLFQLIAVYNPLKLFLPLVMACAGLAAGSLAWAVARASAAALLASSIYAATTLLLVAASAATYVLSRVGQHPAPLVRGPHAARDHAPSPLARVP